jgi:magnesium chelatase family protein
MLYKIFSASLLGIDAFLVEVEVDISRGIPGYVIVGLPDASVRESKDRVYAALKNCGYGFPSRKIIINMAPASRKKEGSAFDLPIALGLLAHLDLFPVEAFKSYMFMGELALDGRLKSVRGSLAFGLLARKMKLKGIVLPKKNEREAGLIRGLEVYGLENLSQVIQLLRGCESIKPCRYSLKTKTAGQRDSCGNFSDIRGQQHAKRALEVAVAGSHNVLMIGPPGAGKTMLARRLPGLLPPLDYEEILEVTRIYSAAGLLKGKGIVRERPFRAPHHTITHAGMVGGGQVPKPGEVTLAHRGVLFLDELPEFQRAVLEDLRQPLEDGCITISRVAHSITFPASFMLVAAMNPCEDVFGGFSGREAAPTDSQRRHYYRKISGPLLDRIDIQVEVPKLVFRDMARGCEGESSETIRNRINAALRFRNQAARRESGNDLLHRGETADIKVRCRADGNIRQLLETAIDKLGFSARACTRVMRVARTIADLEQVRDISAVHVSEAVQYRILDRHL